MFRDHLIVSASSSFLNCGDSPYCDLVWAGMDTASAAGYCPRIPSDDKTIGWLANRFAPTQSSIYSRAQFNRRVQRSGETYLQFVTELLTLCPKCSYPRDIIDHLIRDRFIAGMLMSASVSSFFKPDSLLTTHSISLRVSKELRASHPCLQMGRRQQPRCIRCRGVVRLNSRDVRR